MRWKTYVISSSNPGNYIVVISAVLGPIVIPFLRKLKVGQTEREELKSHLKKTGTPTMGGIIILASVILTSLIYVKDYPEDHTDLICDRGLWNRRIFR